MIIYTLARHSEVGRYKHVAELFQRIDDEEVEAVTSFYALHEVFLFALRNAPDPATGAQAGKASLLEILKTKIRLTPLPTREERILYSRTFSALSDASDVSHAISALLVGCDTIISYDHHFDEIASILPMCLPEEFASEIA